MCDDLVAVAAEPRKSAGASSLAFDGDDAKTLYIAACEHIYAVRLRAPGLLQGPAAAKGN